MKGYWSYDFKTDDKSEIEVRFEEHEWSDEESSWTVDFRRDGAMNITGEGDAMRIFATVIQVIKEFIKKEKPQMLNFSAHKPLTDPGNRSSELTSRERLYKRMIQKYARQMKYDYTTRTDNSATDFSLVRK